MFIESPPTKNHPSSVGAACRLQDARFPCAPTEETFWGRRRLFGVVGGAFWRGAFWGRELFWVASRELFGVRFLVVRFLGFRFLVASAFGVVLIHYIKHLLTIKPRGKG